MRRGSTLPGLKGGLEMTSSDRIGSTALVTGASRGFGRAIATALLLTPAGLTRAG
jgi:NADP-dependent 3-hydroxy acid dehydrogenase YdfG